MRAEGHATPSRKIGGKETAKIRFAWVVQRAVTSSSCSFRQACWRTVAECSAATSRPTTSSRVRPGASFQKVSSSTVIIRRLRTGTPPKGPVGLLAQHVPGELEAALDGLRADRVGPAGRVHHGTDEAGADDGQLVGETHVVRRQRPLATRGVHREPRALDPARAHDVGRLAEQLGDGVQVGELDGQRVHAA